MKLCSEPYNAVSAEARIRIQLKLINFVAKPITKSVRDLLNRIDFLSKGVVTLKAKKGTRI